MISLDQGQSAATRPAQQGNNPTVRFVVRDEVSQPLEDMHRQLDDHTRRYTANELQAWQLHLNQQEKDRCFHVLVFSNKAA